MFCQMQMPCCVIVIDLHCGYGIRIEAVEDFMSGCTAIQKRFS